MNKIKKLKKIRIHHEGTHILITGAILLVMINLALYWGIKCKIPFYVCAVISVALYLLVVNFFRCPIRLFKGDTEKTVVAPADGRIVVIEEVDEHEYFHDRRLMISIFMDITNVHANWYPVDGVVKYVAHHDGRFMKAWLPKASTENERSTIVIETPEGHTVMARQIAGAVARRIVTLTNTWDSSNSVHVWMCIFRWGQKCWLRWGRKPRAMKPLSLNLNNYPDYG